MLVKLFHYIKQFFEDIDLKKIDFYFFYFWNYKVGIHLNLYLVNIHKSLENYFDLFHLNKNE